MEKLSYAWGLAMGRQLQGMGMKELNVKDFSDGVASVFEQKEPAMSPEEAQKLIQDYLNDLQQKAEEAAKAAGTAFLKENKQNPNVKETSTGLQYVVEKEGTGAQPTAEDEVTVHYTGRLLDGTVFDSSVNRGEPATFPLNRVIAGWTEGLQLMKEGGKTIFYIPYQLGYGEEGAGPQIPPCSDLIFEVELLKVNE